jgi:hypothetical protein
MFLTSHPALRYVFILVHSFKPQEKSVFHLVTKNIKIYYINAAGYTMS